MFWEKEKKQKQNKETQQLNQQAKQSGAFNFCWSITADQIC